MRSAVFYGKHDLRVEEASVPQVGSQDVLIQVKACGVCGTDVHIYQGDKGAAEVTPPTILGHEFSGVVAEVGNQVKNFKPGDRVCVDPNCYCGKCEPCQDGKCTFLSAYDWLRHYSKRRFCPVLCGKRKSGLSTGREYQF